MTNVTSPGRALIAPVDPQRMLRLGAARRRRRARIRRNRLIASLIVVLIGMLAFLAVSAGGSPSSLTAGDQPVVSLTSQIARQHVVPGRLGGFPWPAKGQGAVAVLGVGLVSSSARSQSVPIASLTKMMTAYVVLHDHPLPLGASGPSFAMTQSDVNDYITASQSNESNVPVTAGEVLSQYQLLEALLIPSADNIADRLARWDAGSLAGFVAKMNAYAKQFGLSKTHYADASGVNAATVSTAQDQAVLAAKLMESPVIRSIVKRPSVAFPVAGTIWNYNPALGSAGIVGVKSGFTSAAQACLATAAYRSLGGHSVLVIAVSTGQPDGLPGAARVDRALLARFTAALTLYRPISAKAIVAYAHLPWSSAATPVRARSRPVILGWPGLVLRTHIFAAPGATPWLLASVGTLEFTVDKVVLSSTPLRPTRALPPNPSTTTSS